MPVCTRMSFNVVLFDRGVGTSDMGDQDGEVAVCGSPLAGVSGGVGGGDILLVEVLVT